MALQDLTPQLRTRFSRMERAVGWFVLLATVLLLLGFGYYLRKTAERKGWFKVKAVYYTYADSGAGLAVGDPVLLLGFPAGVIKKIEAMDPGSTEGNVYVEFEILEPYFGYLWTDSEADLTAAGFLGKRQMEVIAGKDGYATMINHPLREVAPAEIAALPHPEKWCLAEEIYDGATNRVIKAWQPLSASVQQQLASLGKKSVRVIDPSVKGKPITGIWNGKRHRYDAYDPAAHQLYGLTPYEEPPLTDRLQELLSKVEAALPGILSLTNQISAVLSNSTQLTANLNVVAENARPIITNLTLISTQLRDPKGSLGEWLIPANLNAQLALTLQNASATMTNANTNIAALAEELGRSLENLAGITSNLNHQVDVNTNILTQISDIVVHSDEFIQGLKRHWLLRSAFKTPKTNAPPARAVEPFRSPKARGN